MARPKNGKSVHSLYRHARERLAELEAQSATLERSRPRTPGKRGSKTRALNALARQIRAAHGQLTKARKAVAVAARERVAAQRTVTRKRSAAAKQGWRKRREHPRPSAAGDIWQHLVPDGATITVVLDKSDSSLEGKYWNAYTAALEGTRDLRDFEGRSVFDLDRQRRFPFVTNLNVIAQHADEIDFGPGFYKRRNEAPGNAA
jgi:hypothetical protein